MFDIVCYKLIYWSKKSVSSCSTVADGTLIQEVDESIFLRLFMKVARELSFSDRRSKRNVSIVVNVSNSMETNFMLDEV